jgi:hypothetical protein
MIFIINFFSFYLLKTKFFESIKLNSLRRYARDGWNKLDILGCLLFLLGFALHVLSKYLDKEKELVFDIGN